MNHITITNVTARKIYDDSIIMIRFSIGDNVNSRICGYNITMNQDYYLV